ncbi:hypothetical protein BOTU111922_07235 [Bordetella tumulicola]
MHAVPLQDLALASGGAIEGSLRTQTKPQTHP